MRLLNAHFVDKSWKPLAVIIGLIVLLYLAGGVGMAYVAGFGAVHARLERAQWDWLLPAVAGIAVSYIGYFFAYRGINRAERGPRLEFSSLLAVVTAGFGGFLAHGGAALDDFAMQAGGADEREASVRVSALAGLEHGALALVACPAAIAAVIVSDTYPRSDFTWPWAVIPPVGFTLAMWFAERYRDRLRGRHGWRGKLGIFLDAIHIVWEILRRPNENSYAMLGMMLYWGGDMFALWATTKAFGFQMTALDVIIAVATGMVLTRRTAPLAGAGLVLVTLVATLWNAAGVPFPAATLGVAAYRMITVFGPMPFGLAALPKLRALGRTGEDAAGEGDERDRGRASPAALGLTAMGQGATAMRRWPHRGWSAKVAGVLSKDVFG